MGADTGYVDMHDEQHKTSSNNVVQPPLANDVQIMKIQQQQQAKRGSLVLPKAPLTQIKKNSKLSNDQFFKLCRVF